MDAETYKQLVPYIVTGLFILVTVVIGIRDGKDDNDIYKS